MRAVLRSIPASPSIRRVSMPVARTASFCRDRSSNRCTRRSCSGSSAKSFSSRAFEAGNYEAVRLGAPKLAAATQDPAVRGAARELRRRIDPDPLMKYLLWVAIALFVFVVWYTYQNHSH